MKRLSTIILVTGILTLVNGCVVGALEENYAPEIVINEVCSWNTCIDGTNRAFDDYLELYNMTDHEVSLDGWYVSDDENNLKKYQLSDLSVESQSYCLLLADGIGENEQRVSFKISSKGEKLFLSDNKGRLIDQVEVPELEANTVWARTTDGGMEWKRMEPSPLDVNEKSSLVRNRVCDKPIFSKKGGFYEKGFFLELSAHPGEIIYYTLDGSEPTKESNQYSDRIRICDVSNRPNVYNSVQNVVANWKEYEPPKELVEKAVVVRAIVMDAYGNTSDVASETYFVGQNQYQNVDVISLIADPEDLFGEEGIYVTGKEYDDWYLSGGEGEAPEPCYMRAGRKREIAGNFQLFEKGQEVLNQAVGLRIQGEGSRSHPRKRFSIFSRKEYGGSTYFAYPLFLGRSTHSLTLNDGFANAFLPYLVKDREIAVQQARPVTVFLNGEYWYTTYMQEKYNQYYLEDAYDVSSDNVIIMKSGNMDEGIKGRFFYEQLWDFMGQTDLTDIATYEDLTEIMDMQSYIDFMCANIYLCNMDVSETHNYMLWRAEEEEEGGYGDKRWRWMLYDMDFIETGDCSYYQVPTMAQIHSFSDNMQYAEVCYEEHYFFSRLMTSEIFREQFVLSFMDMANTNFSPEYVEKMLKEWGRDLSWRDYFFCDRFDTIVPDLAEEFSLQGDLVELTVRLEDPKAGYIQVNTCTPDLSGGTWSGKYYTDYPVVLTAVPREGYRFIGWRGDRLSEENTLSIDLKQENTIVEAVFERVE